MNKELVKVYWDGMNFNTGNVLYDQVSFDMVNLIIRELNTTEYPEWYVDYICDCQKKMYDTNYKNMNKITNLIDNLDVGFPNKIDVEHEWNTNQSITISGKIRYVKAWKGKVHPLYFNKEKGFDLKGYEMHIKMSDTQFSLQYVLSPEKIDSIYKLSLEDRKHMQQLIVGLGQDFYDDAYITYESELALSGLVYDYILGKTVFDDVLASVINLVNTEKEYRLKFYNKIKKMIGVK